MYQGFNIDNNYFYVVYDFSWWIRLNFSRDAAMAIINEKRREHVGLMLAFAGIKRVGKCI
jgi:hypothetical protein